MAHPTPSCAACTSLLITLVLVCASAHSEDPVESVASAHEIAVAELVARPIPTQFSVDPGKRTLRPVLPIRARLVPGEFGRHLEPAVLASFDQTDGALDRLMSTRRLELLTFMRSESTALFFGVNESGRLGVHFDGSLLMAPAK